MVSFMGCTGLSAIHIAVGYTGLNVILRKLLFRIRILIYEVRCIFIVIGQSGCWLAIIPVVSDDVEVSVSDILFVPGVYRMPDQFASVKVIGEHLEGGVPITCMLEL